MLGIYKQNWNILTYLMTKSFCDHMTATDHFMFLK